MLNWCSRSGMVVALLSAIALGAPALNAAMITGTVNIGGAVGVGAVDIDFQLPVGPPNGEFSVTNTGNSGSFAGLGGTSGTILDLNALVQPAGQNVLLPGFITFASAPNIRFDLTFVTPGIYSSANCGAPAAAGQTCTPGPLPNGSPNPFNLSNLTESSSSVSISVRGNAVDTTTNETTPFFGVFTTQFPNLSYQDLLSAVQEGGTIDTSYSASFTATAAAVPEPGVLTLMGVGLTLLGLVRRRQS